jgi:hypothetical protein
VYGPRAAGAGVGAWLKRTPAADSKKVAASLWLLLCALEPQIPASLRLITHCFGITARELVSQRICGTFSLTPRHRTAILRFTVKKQIPINK